MGGKKTLGAVGSPAAPAPAPDVDEAGGAMLLKIFGGKDTGHNNVFRRAAGEGVYYQSFARHV